MCSRFVIIDHDIKLGTYDMPDSFTPIMQVFVANPKKPPLIETILRRNKDKLLVFLKSFHNDKEGTYRFGLSTPFLLVLIS
jgi:hypothetical protein